MLLAAGMENPDSYARWFALRAGRLSGDPGLAAAARRAVERGDRYEQALALEIIEKGRPEESRALLISLLESPFRTTRLRALRALARLADPALVGVFTKVLTSDADPDVRATAARSLGATRSPDARVALYRGLDDSMLSVQEECVYGLVAIQDPDVGRVLLRRLLAAPSERKVPLLRLIALTGDRQVVEELGPLLADGDPEVRSFAAGAILALLRREESR
jgi:HEAT repeat protein